MIAPKRYPTRPPTDRPKGPRSAVIAGARARNSGVRLGTGQTVAEPPGRRVNWVTVGACVGALSLGAVGVTVAASYSYRHPAGLAIGILWWAVYCGCLGTGLGALLGLWVQRGAAPSASGPPNNHEPPATAKADVTAEP